MELSMEARLAACSTAVLALWLLAGCAAALGLPSLSGADEEFLEDLSRRAFLYFWEQADPRTGLVRDRAPSDGAPREGNNAASIAATGFGLTALCIAAERRWVSPHRAQERVRVTLRFLLEQAPHQNGWFYHWMDVASGERVWNSEVSSIDTALLMGGVLTARQRFVDDPEIVRLATALYERIDFPWMLNGHPTLLAMDWKPERGFRPSRWDGYFEQLILILLAVGSPTHPITPSAWYAWHHEKYSYAGYTYLNGGSLFTHQYSHAWVDFRNRREISGWHTDYFANSIAATRAHRAFCLDLAKEFPGYSENVWGITASDSVNGYIGWGGPPRHWAIDGTVVPAAAGGSLMFAPDISLPALRTMREQYGARLYGRYGFVDAFNPNSGWVAQDVIGINQGIILLSAENLRTGNVWRWFMRNREIANALYAVGLRHTGEHCPLSKLVDSNERSKANSVIGEVLRMSGVIPTLSSQYCWPLDKS
jgi:hypothetical protein